MSVRRDLVRLLALLRRYRPAVALLVASSYVATALATAKSRARGAPGWFRAPPSHLPSGWPPSWPMPTSGG